MESNKIRLEIEAGEHQLRVYQNNKIIDEQIFIIDEPKSIEYIIKKKYQAEYAKGNFSAHGMYFISSGQSINLFNIKPVQ